MSDQRINLLPFLSFMEMECPWLEFAGHLLSFTQGYLLKSMPSHPLHLSGCLTGPEAGFLLDTAWIMKCRRSGGDRQWVIMLIQYGWGRCSCFIMSNVAEGKHVENAWKIKSITSHPMTLIQSNWCVHRKYHFTENIIIASLPLELIAANVIQTPSRKPNWYESIIKTDASCVAWRIFYLWQKIA